MTRHRLPDRDPVDPEQTQPIVSRPEEITLFCRIIRRLHALNITSDQRHDHPDQ